MKQCFFQNIDCHIRQTLLILQGNKRPRGHIAPISNHSPNWSNQHTEQKKEQLNTVSLAKKLKNLLVFCGPTFLQRFMIWSNFNLYNLCCQTSFRCFGWMLFQKILIFFLYYLFVFLHKNWTTSSLFYVLPIPKGSWFEQNVAVYIINITVHAQYV